MSGNVVEWCWDLYADNGTWPNYAITGTLIDFTGAPSGSYRIVRGGSFAQEVSGCAVSFRYGESPYRKLTYNGFRVVRR